MLHFGGAEDDLAIADEQKGTVAQIGEEERRVVQQREDAGGRSSNALFMVSRGGL